MAWLGCDGAVCQLYVPSFPAVEVHVPGFVLGALLATWVGHRAAKEVRDKIREELGEPADKAADRRAKWVGYTERCFFGIGTVVFPPIAVGGMVGWTGLKLGANWGSREAEEKDLAVADDQGQKDAEEKPTKKKDPDLKLRIKRLSALAATLASLTFALLGGLLVRWSLSP